HAGLTAAGRAGRRVHLARAAVAAVPAAHRSLARLAALWAARSGVHQTPARGAVFVSDREHEVRARLPTRVHLSSDHVSDRSPDRTAPLASRSTPASVQTSYARPTQIFGDERCGGELRGTVRKIEAEFSTPAGNRRAFTSVRESPGHAQKMSPTPSRASIPWP